jgi:hypothetical protein
LIDIDPIDDTGAVAIRCIAPGVWLPSTSSGHYDGTGARDGRGAASSSTPAARNDGRHCGAVGRESARGRRKRTRLP